MDSSTILVVEDELPLQNAIKAKLEKTGFQVLTARSVDQAKNHLQDVEDIAAIWLDHYLLGKEDGLDFVVFCKQEETKFKNIPIFVISNTASADKVTSYIQLGVSEYFVKAEMRLDEIIESIKKQIDAKE